MQVASNFHFLSRKIVVDVSLPELLLMLTTHESDFAVVTKQSSSHGHTTTAFCHADGKLYRAPHPRGIKRALTALAAYRPGLRVLGQNELLVESRYERKRQSRLALRAAAKAAAQATS